MTRKLTLEPVDLLLKLLNGPLGEFGASLSLETGVKPPL